MGRQKQLRKPATCCRPVSSIICRSVPSRLLPGMPKPQPSSTTCKPGARLVRRLRHWLVGFLKEDGRSILCVRACLFAHRDRGLFLDLFSLSLSLHACRYEAWKGRLVGITAKPCQATSSAVCESSTQSVSSLSSLTIQIAKEST